MAKDGISSGLPHLQRALKEQSRYTTRELGPIIDNRGRRFRFALYREFRDIAPEKGEIREEVAALDYAIKRRKSARTGKPLTLEQEIKSRESSRKFLAAEFITPDWKNKKGGQRLTVKARKRRSQRGELGRAIINTKIGEKNPFVRIEGFLDGAAKINRQYGIVRKVEAAQVRDIGRYTARKIEQRNRQIYRSISKTLLAVAA